MHMHVYHVVLELFGLVHVAYCDTGTSPGGVLSFYYVEPLVAVGAHNREILASKARPIRLIHGEG